MKNNIDSLIKKLKKIKSKLTLKQINLFKTDIEKAVERTKLQDINLFIKELEKIKKGD